MDDNWADNVDPLLQALERLGIDPVEWAADHDFAPFFKEGTREVVDELAGIEPDQVFFACGYMQATANLTYQTWAGQIADHLASRRSDG